MRSGLPRMPRSVPDARGGATLDAGAFLAFERGQRHGGRAVVTTAVEDMLAIDPSVATVRS